MTLMERRRALMASGAKTVHGTWEDLFRAIDAGTYATDYQQGETIELDLGSTLGVINMEISNFDVDVLASDQSQKAPVSLVAKELLAVAHRWNPANSETEAPYTSGTGVFGGWQDCELRNWLNTDVMQSIPSNVSRRIVDVRKNSYSTDADGASSVIAYSDKLFVPNGHETGTRNWDSGPVYFALNSAEKRTKYFPDGTTAQFWWTRTVNVNAPLTKVLRISTTGSGSGAVTQGDPGDTAGICLCFCLG